jgi:hypothetical protein
LTKEGEAMTAWVLVLAGVTAGDGGMGMGPAREPVWAVPRLDVKWEGEGHVLGRPVSVRLDRDRLSWGDGSYVVVYHSPTFHPGGRVGGGELTYKLEGDRLTIRGGGLQVAFGHCNCRFVLHPVARKP